jgi:ACS family tartrate transporter-like MFS transporter
LSIRGEVQEVVSGFSACPAPPVVVVCGTSPDRRAMPDPAPTPDELARGARRKVAWRVLPLLFLLYVIAYLDRANVGFAKLRMQADLGFSEAVFGYGFGLFFVGYMFLEIPGALFVEHWSARKWFARILVTWGALAMAMALVETPTQFYLVRFLLGLAEAGFFPGVIVYFSHWFPRKDRARAMSAMLLGVPLSMAFGAPVTAVLLEQDGFGLTGWQWVFLVEGAPAVLLGVAVPFLLTDRPRQARWLTPEEREWLEGALEAERRATAPAGRASLGQALRTRNVWLLALAILATNLGGYVFVFWMAAVVQGLLAAAGRGTDPTNVLSWTTFVFLSGAVGVRVSGWSSDRTGDRKGHCAAGQLGAALFITLAMVPGQPWVVVFAWLCLVGFFANFWFTPFWVLPTTTLTSSAAAVSIGVINMCGNIAGAVGNPVVGEMKDAGWGDQAAMAFVAASFALGAAFVSMVRVPPREGASE